jgi:glutamate formiminotransferase
MLIECVPNVSEGRDAGVLAALAAAVRGVPGAVLADVHADPDHHRSVFTCLGPPSAVEAAALALAAAAVQRIDMRRHQGAHPRLGALDVLPFVPLAGAAMADAVALAHRVGRALAAAHDLPVYFYGAAARRPGRERLPEVRRGQYEGLAARLGTLEGSPDEGPARFDPRSGAIAVGARGVLVAYNVWLDTDDLRVARAVAAAVGERGGGLASVLAIGVALPSRRLTAVAMNLLDSRTTSIPAAHDRVAAEAARRGAGIARAELVGLAPRAAFAGRTPESVGLPDFTTARELDTHVAAVLAGTPTASPGPSESG